MRGAVRALYCTRREQITSQQTLLITLDRQQRRCVRVRESACSSSHVVGAGCFRAKRSRSHATYTSDRRTHARSTDNLRVSRSLLLWTFAARVLVLAQPELRKEDCTNTKKRCDFNMQHTFCRGAAGDPRSASSSSSS